MFSSRRLIVLLFTFMSTIHLKLVFEFGVRRAMRKDPSLLNDFQCTFDSVTRINFPTHKFDCAILLAKYFQWQPIVLGIMFSLLLNVA